MRRKKKLSPRNVLLQHVVTRVCVCVLMTCGVGHSSNSERDLRVYRAPLQRLDALAGVCRRLPHVHHASGASRAGGARRGRELGVDCVHRHVARTESLGRCQVG